MKSILFDLYGTLVDVHTNEESLSFWNSFTHKTKKYKDFTNEDLKTNYLELCTINQELKEELDIVLVFKELFNVEMKDAYCIAHIFRKCSTQYCRLYKGVKQLLKTLRKQGDSVYLLSNAQKVFTIPEIKKLGILKYFNGIAISSDYGIKKPNPQFLKQAMKDFEMNVKDTYMIGNDYICDIHPAKKLGIKTIFIKSNLTPSSTEIEDMSGFQKNKILEIINKK